MPAASSETWIYMCGICLENCPAPSPPFPPPNRNCQEAEAAQDEPMDQAEDARRYDKRQR